jgi:hypothetical protein
MSIRISLELPEEVARVAQESADRAGLSLDEVLITWLCRAADHWRAELID